MDDGALREREVEDVIVPVFVELALNVDVQDGVEVKLVGVEVEENVIVPI